MDVISLGFSARLRARARRPREDAYKCTRREGWEFEHWFFVRDPWLTMERSSLYTRHNTATRDNEYV